LCCRRMASELCKEEYDYVKVDIITNFGVGVTVGSETGFQRTVEAARKSAKWDELGEPKRGAKTASVAVELPNAK